MQTNNWKKLSSIHLLLVWFLCGLPRHGIRMRRRKTSLCVRPEFLLLPAGAAQASREARHQMVWSEATAPLFQLVRRRARGGGTICWIRWGQDRCRRWMGRTGQIGTLGCDRSALAFLEWITESRWECKESSLGTLPCINTNLIQQKCLSCSSVGVSTYPKQLHLF